MKHLVVKSGEHGQFLQRAGAVIELDGQPLSEVRRVDIELDCRSIAKARIEVIPTVEYAGPADVEMFCTVGGKLYSLVERKE